MKLNNYADNKECLDKTFCVTLNANMKGIRTQNEEGIYYYDVLDKDNNIILMEGEECKITGYDELNNLVELNNISSGEDITLTYEQYLEYIGLEWEIKFDTIEEMHEYYGD